MTHSIRTMLASPESNPALVFIPIAILIVTLVILSKRGSRKKKTVQAVAEQQFQNALQGFVISKKLEVGFCTVLVDDIAKRIAFSQNQSIQIYNFSEILDFELNEDGTSIAKGRGLNAAIGAAAFGVAGAIVGASGKRANDSICTSMVVRIVINDLQTPQIVIHVISFKTKKESIAYRSGLEAAKNLIATLTYIDNYNATASKPPLQ